MPGEQESERELEPLLRQVLRQSAAEAASPCPDAGVLAAWAEGALRADEAVAFEAHAAGCDRCRAMMAAFIRAGEPVAAAVPATVPVSPDEPASDGLRFWQRWRLAYLVPVAATATAIALYVAAPEPVPPAVDSTSAANAAQERVNSSRDVNIASQPSMAAKSAEAAPPAASTPASTPGKALNKETALDAASGAGASGAASAELSAPAAAAAMAAPELVAPSPAPVAGGVLAPAAVAAPRPAAPPPSPEDRRFAAPDSRPPEPAPSVSERADTAARARVAPPTAAADASPALAGPVRRLTGSVPVDAGGAGNAAVAGAAGQWRVSDRGGVSTLERSLDDVRWDAVTLPSGVAARDLLAAAVTDRSETWLVGRAGLTLYAADGRAFVRTAAPLPIDLTTVQATGTRSAAVTTVDGRTFVTRDAGQTWSLR